MVLPICWNAAASSAGTVPIVRPRSASRRSAAAVASSAMRQPRSSALAAAARSASCWSLGKPSKARREVNTAFLVMVKLAGVKTLA